MYVELPEERLERENFEAAQKDLLSDFPEEFHSCMRRTAWDRGHSCGYAEVLNELIDLISMLREPIDAFAARLQGK